MFIRETTKSKKGKIYTQHQLIESVRTPKGPRQKLVINLGKLNIPKDKWKELANSIESKLHGYQNFFTPDFEIEKLAAYYSDLIKKERLNKESEKNYIESDEPLYESVDINSISTSDCKTIGAEHVVLSQMNEYNFDKILEYLDFSEKEIALSKMIITARLVHPASERETARWINKNSAISELLQSKTKVYDNALHRTSALLFKYHEEIETRLAAKAREIFNLNETIILYDLTNTYFEGSKKNSKKAKPGKSKERRNDSPLVTLALTVDSQGFPKKSKIYEGNISEPGTLENILTEISQQEKTFDNTIVIDAGIASEENINLLKEKGFKYVAVSRKRSFPEDFWAESTESTVSLDDHNRLKLKLVKENNESWLLCHSDFKEEKEAAILSKKLEKFEADLNKLKTNLHKKGTRKQYKYIVEKIGRLKEKYGVGTLYNIEVEKNQDNIVTNIAYIKNPKGKAKELNLGKYVLRTNRLDLDEKEISKIHRSLTIVENSFKVMKSNLGLRPLFHQRDDATEAHIFVSVIGYHFLAGILKKLGYQGIHYQWDTIKNILSTHTRVTTSFKTEDNAIIDIRNNTTPTAQQDEIYKGLGINKQPLKRVTLKTPIDKKKCSDEK